MKIRDKGYWVSKLFYIRSWIHWLLSSLRFHSITFFSAVNPALHLGGMLDDRKSDIYDMLPDRYLPKTIVLDANDKYALEKLSESGIQYPLITKPNVGYKGYMVRRVENEAELLRVLKKFDNKEILIQEFLKHDREFSLLFYRLPLTNAYGVSSLVEKKLPYLEGDGKSTLRELIEKEGSAFLDKNYILSKRKEDLSSIIPNGIKETIDHVGNYARGAKFYSLNHCIDNEIIESGKRFFNHLDGINFGRIDLKANSLEDIKNNNFKILEVNGAKAEPLHMYEPTMSWLRIWHTISEHWSILNKIAREQLSSAYNLPSAKDGIAAAKSLKRQTTN